ncbi:MAG TPA: hypothetical protein VNT92_06515 [Acidimicrobiia bacterium]|nr:hypothetical protein [Acidimicrobiia bacterium]
MDLQTSSHYQLTIRRPGHSEPDCIEVYYERPERHDDDVVHYFVGPDRFHVGIPDHLIGSDFEIEPI